MHTNVNLPLLEPHKYVRETNPSVRPGRDKKYNNSHITILRIRVLS
jgi:hypothetical protein